MNEPTDIPLTTAEMAEILGIDEDTLIGVDYDTEEVQPPASSETRYITRGARTEEYATYYEDFDSFVEFIGVDPNAPVFIEDSDA